MTKKKAVLLNTYWQMLHNLNEFYGRNVTAGELAGEAGVTRNTAKKWLDELIVNKGAGSTEVLGKNHQTMTMYYAISVDPELTE